jgi:hypothetical protein
LLIPNEKICTKCQIIKPLSGFYTRKTGKIRNECKECEKASAKKWNQQNKEKYNTNRTRHHRKYPERQKNRILKRDYGISYTDYQKMLIDQDFSCAICKVHQKDLNKSLHVDHNHSTGEVRSLLCAPCNTSLGALKENTETLNSMIEYIKKFRK